MTPDMDTEIAALLREAAALIASSERAEEPACKAWLEREKAARNSVNCAPPQPPLDSFTEALLDQMIREGEAETQPRNRVNSPAKGSEL